MIDENKRAFSNLIKQLTDKIELPIEEGKRYIRTDDTERQWLQKSKIESVLYITPNIRSVLITLEEVVYIAIIGVRVNLDDIDDSILKEINLNAGLITLLISKEYLKLNSNTNSLVFFENILSQHKDKDYKGHSYWDLIPFLEEIKLLEIPKPSIIKTNIINRISCYVFSKNQSLFILNFDDNFLNRFSEIAIRGCDDINYDILLNTIFSTTYKHSFLELYRLIERLFPVSYLKDFHFKAKSELSFFDFISELEEITKWRPEEHEAVKRVFDETNETTKEYFNDFQNKLIERNEENISKYFYKLRNSIVHFRANHKEYILDEKQWNALLIATINLIDEQYSKHKDLLKG